MKERPPDLFDYARERRDTGIERVVDKADELDPGWSDGAYEQLCLFCKERSGEPFLAEEVRLFADRRGFARPHDGRAWGAVMQRGVRNLLIRKDGFAPAASSNLSPKVRWVALP